MDEIKWPAEVNLDMKINIVADKVNEIIRSQQKLGECNHESVRELANGRKMCNQCKKFVKLG